MDFAPRQSTSGNFCFISSSIYAIASPITIKFLRTASCLSQSSKNYSFVVVLATNSNFSMASRI